jgi:CheY-like chemotaxis protein
MSHEMRTPMNAIIGMTAIGKKAADIEKKDYCLNKIEDASVHLLGVINDVLDMSKIEANKLELLAENFNFRKMIRNVTGIINFRINEKKQLLTVTVGETVPAFLLGDEQRLAQVITNLLSNAVKFTPENGSITLDSRLVKTEDGYRTILITVRDTGIGISKEQQARLFNSFQQADSGTSRKFGGTGLGLALSKRIVELMDGHIWIESELNKGASFIFTVRLKEAALEEASAASLAPEEKQAEKTDDFSGSTMLLAEDVDINREIVISLLEPSRIVIDCAENGAQAVKMFSENPDKYGIIFMDIHMPEMDGYEATRRIRAFEEERRKKSALKFPKEIPIVAMTANVFKEDIEKCFAAGMNDHIGKPLNIDEMVQKLRKYLN